MTQKEMILRHLKDFGTIQPMEALTDYSVYRLAAVIKDLRDDGYRINTIMIPHTNKYGIKTKYAKYHLVQQKPKRTDYSSDYERATNGY